MFRLPFPEPESLNLPAWLDDCRMPDNLPGQAYDAVPANYRAALKTGIAIAAALRRRQPARRASSRLLTESGQRHCQFSQPAAWTAVCFDCRHEAAARLTAAFVWPLLAGVGNVFAICSGGEPGVAACMALEMCGIADAFMLDEAQCSRLLKELGSLPASGAGRLLILRGFPAASPESALPATYQEKWLPEIYAQGRHDREMLAFLHGRECLKFSPPPAYADALIIDNPDRLPACSCRLILAPGCEGFWQFPDLDSDFFFVKSSLFALAEPCSPDMTDEVW